MADIPIFIPSRSRHDQPLATLENLPAELWDRVTMFVPHEQIMDYSITFPTVNLVTVSGLEHSIAHKRHQMGLWAREQGHERFYTLDDDLTFFKRIDPEQTALLKITTLEEFTEMLDYCEQRMTDGDYAVVGISMRQGNNTFQPWGIENDRCIRASLFNTEDFLSVEHERVDYMEDMDVLIQLLKKGRKNYLVTNWCQNQNNTQLPGGCSDHRTVERHNASARRMADLHPGICHLQYKEYKSAGGDLRVREEVRVYWKKAYKAKVFADAMAELEAELAEVRKKNAGSDGSECAESLAGGAQTPEHGGGMAGDA